MSKRWHDPNPQLAPALAGKAGRGIFRIGVRAAWRGNEGFRRLELYRRRILALECGIRLRPGEAGEGLDAGWEMGGVRQVVENVEEYEKLEAFVEKLLADMAALEERLLALERFRDGGGNLVTGVTGSVTENVTGEHDAVTERDGAVTDAERAKRYRERKRAERAAIVDDESDEGGHEE